MFCPNCGTKAEDNAQFCGKCGNPLTQPNPQVVTVPGQGTVQVQQVVVVPVETPEEKHKGNVIGFIVVGLNYILPFLMGMIGAALDWDSEVYSPIISICGLAALILLIYGRVTYPKNTFLKILMWLVIIGLIAVVLIVCSYIIACGNALGNC